MIWEPVLTTDWGTPSPSLTGYLADRRVRHYWDRNRELSAAYGGVSKIPSLAKVRHIGFRMKDVIWDAALVYAPGVRWGEPAQLLAAPVVRYPKELTSSLQPRAQRANQASTSAGTHMLLSCQPNS